MKVSEMTVDEADKMLKKVGDVLRKAVQTPTGNRHIVVLDRGWIFVGDLSHNNGIYTLTNCQNIRKWEKGGFGALSKSGKDAGAHLDAAAAIQFRTDAMIFSVPVSEDWS